MGRTALGIQGRTHKGKVILPGPPSRRENELLDKKTFTAVHADIVFSKVKAKGERRINFEDFKDAVSMVAEMKGMTFEVLCGTIHRTGGPRSSVGWCKLTL